MAETFTISVESGPLAAREALGQIFNQLAPMSLDTEEQGTIELVLAEALNNVVEHAYSEPESTGQIHVFGAERSDGLHFRLEDQGKPMPDGQIPFGVAPRHDVDLMDLPEGGFGWFLVQDLAKDVTYERMGDTNILRLRLAITRNG